MKNHSNSVVVDDLDPGFLVDESNDKSAELPWFLRFAQVAFGERPKDQGLTSYATTGFNITFGAFGEWSRQQLDQAYGKYRRTLARAFQGSTVANVHFEASLPTNGNWKLEYHVPDVNSLRSGGGAGFRVNVEIGSRRGRERWGDFDMWVTDGDRVVPIEFDGESIDEGWNLLGEFELENPLVTVSVSTNTTRGSVIADAIRWTPAS